ncbi:MAG: 3'(2'),5'-bisphosphate nucleotidase [Phycisphaerales bacterium]
MTDYIHAIEAAKLAVARACVVCRSVQRQLDSVRASFKDDKSPVTVADYASQAVVVWTLTDMLGATPIVGEESADDLRAQLAAGDTRQADAVLNAVHRVLPDLDLDTILDAIDAGNSQTPPHHHPFWTLDPIDGTKGFLRAGQYAVSLAWIEHSRPIIGALGCPNLSTDLSHPIEEPHPTGSIYLAEAGNGVYELHADDDLTAASATPTRLRRLPRAEGQPLRMCESVEAAHTSHDDAERIIERLGEPAQPIRLDGQGKYAVVARGQADFYLRLPRTPKPGKTRYIEKIWDHAAGALVAAELGCTVSDTNAEPLDFSHGTELRANAGIIVADPALHARILEVIERLGINYEIGS